MEQEKRKLLIEFLNWFDYERKLDQSEIESNIDIFLDTHHPESTTIISKSDGKLLRKKGVYFITDYKEVRSDGLVK